MRIKKVESINIRLYLIITLMIIGFTSCIGTYAYFTAEVDAIVDLVITPGVLSTHITDGINEDIYPGEITEYKEFSIINTGTLNQNINISFQHIDEIQQEDKHNITYELLQIENNTTKTILHKNIQELQSTNLNFTIKNNSQLNLISRIITTNNLSDNVHDKTLNIRVNINASQTNDHNNQYFKASDYQENFITINKPKEEEIIKHNFDIDVDTRSIDNEIIQFTLDLKNYFDTKEGFSFQINNREGVFFDKKYLVSAIPSTGKVNISINNDYINIDDISTVLPSPDRFDATIYYKNNGQDYTKDYSIEFIRVDNDANLIRAYFYEH